MLFPQSGSENSMTSVEMLSDICDMSFALHPHRHCDVVMHIADLHTPWRQETPGDIQRRLPELNWIIVFPEFPESDGQVAKGIGGVGILETVFTEFNL